MSQQHQFALLDLRGLILHSYHAGMAPEPLMGEIKEKVNTGAYGFTTFLNMYYDLIVDTIGSPLNMIAVLDSGNVYRKGLYPEYKAKRGEVEHDPVEKLQIDICTDLVKNFLVSMGVPLVRVVNVEADDVIGYLSQKLHGNIAIYTRDKDLVALRNERVTVFASFGPKDPILPRTFVKSDGLEVPASCITVCKSLLGDSSDGYPGVKGLGPKAWESLVAEFGHDGMEQLSQLLDAGNVTQIKAIAKVTANKAYLKAVADIDNWLTMYKVAKITPSLCYGAKNKLDWYKRAPTLERLTKVMNEAGCPDLIAKYADDTYQQTLVTSDNLSDVFKQIEALTEETPFVAWDYETWDTKKDPRYQEASNGRGYVDMLNSDIAGCSFALGRNVNKVFYFSTGHANTNNVPKQYVLEVIKHFEDEGKVMVAQNIAFEATITKVNFGHEVKHWEDTKLYAHHVDENSENGLKFLSKHYLNYNQVSYKDTLDAAGASDMSEISGEQVLSYGCDDSLVTAHLYQHFKTITMLEGTFDFIEAYECPAVAPLIDAHINGVKVDVAEMDRQRAADEVTVKEKMEAIRAALNEHCREPNLAGVDTLLSDQIEYVTYKAKQDFIGKNPAAGPAEIQAAVKAAVDDYRVKLKKNSFYVPPVEVKKFKEFIPTAVMLTKVAEKLGLPAFEKVSKTAISDWIDDVYGTFMGWTDENRQFMNLLAPAVGQFSKREGKDYEAFATFCNHYLEQDAKIEIQGTELNMGSPAQNQYLFYLLLGLPIRNRTKVQKGSLRDKAGFEGSPATDEAAVEFALANDVEEHPWKKQVLEDLLEYKSAATRIGIYWTPYPLWLDENDIMHPGFSSCGTVTRRPTGKDPNLLQVSKGDVRKVFIPRSDKNVIVSIDFSSEELRVLASACGDPTFLSAYQGVKDKDLHALTACGLVPLLINRLDKDYRSDIVYESPILVNYDWFKEHQDDDNKLGKFLKEMRGYAKTANFGVGYGAGPSTISRQLMIPLKDAELIVESMNNTYPGIQKWKDNVYAQAKIDGYVATTYGSRRHCGDSLIKGSRSEISRWERQLSNFLIQGQCADLLKVALVALHRNNTLAKHGAMLIAPIYDELLFEVPKTSLHQFLLDASDDMEQEMPGIIIPMVADCSFGPNWGQQIEVGTRPSKETVDAALLKLVSMKEAA